MGWGSSPVRRYSCSALECPYLQGLETSTPPQFCPVPQTRLYYTAAAVVAATYPVCVGLLRLGVTEKPGMRVQEECGKQKRGAGLLLGMGFGLELCHAEMLPSCVAEPSTPASSQGPGFLAGLGLTVRHPPYLTLVISFLLISAAIQVRLARPVPIGPVHLHPTTSHLGLRLRRERPVAGIGLERLVREGRDLDGACGLGKGEGLDTGKNSV